MKKLIRAATATPNPETQKIIDYIESEGLVFQSIDWANDFTSFTGKRFQAWCVNWILGEIEFEFGENIPGVNYNALKQYLRKQLQGYGGGW